MMNKKTHLIYLVLLFVTFFSNVTPHKCLAFEIKSRQITMADGLSNNTVRHLFQDSKGFMWIATANGLNRYDGHNFKLLLPSNNTISLADRRVLYMDEDKNGFLWVKMSPNYISCYDLANDRFVDFTGCGRFKTPYRNWLFLGNDTWLWGEEGCRRTTLVDGKFHSEEFSKKNGRLLTNDVKQVVADGRNVWLMPAKGLYLWSNGRLHLVNGSKSFICTFTNNRKRWFVATDGSICQYNGKLTITGSRIPNIYKREDLTGHITIGNKCYLFTASGSFSLDMNSGQLSRVSGNLDIPKAEVLTDNAGDYWLYNKTGVLRYVNHATGQVRAFKLMTNNKVRTLDQERYNVVRTRNGLSWLTTNGCGLYAFDPGNDRLYHYTTEEPQPSVLTTNSQLCITEDRSGNIWMGTWAFGVTQLNISGLNAYDTPFYDRITGHIRMIEKDNNGVWLSNTEGILYQLTPDIGTLNKTTNELCNIYAIGHDAHGTTWYGTRTKGLRIGNRWYTHNANEPSSIGSNAIFDILRDQRNRMWLATFGGGLCLAQPDGKGGYRFRQFINANYGLSRLRCLSMDRNGWLWAGTSEGLVVFQPDRLIRNPKDYYLYNWNNGQLNSNEIRSIKCDSKGIMWIAETGSGFAVCKPSNNYSKLAFTHFTTKDGLSNGMVQAFAEDKQGRMWLSTAYGLSCFSLANKTFRNFYFSSSIAGNTYSENCATTLADGRLLFGTNDGIAVLEPKQISDKGKAVNVTFTDLVINGIHLQPEDKDYPLEKALPYTKEISLAHEQNSFSISFSTLEYPVSAQTLYSYKLEPYEDEWSSPSTLDFASYKNLKPGTYVLHVKATDSEGVWSAKENAITITIRPPFYATSGAFFIYLLAAIGIGYSVIRTIRKMDKLRTQVKVEEQLADYKLSFFTNVSHEFRTPLTLIQAAMEHLHNAGKDEEKRKEGMHLMERSVSRMLRLVNELLEFRKAEKGKLSLALEKVDVIALLKDYFTMFKSTAAEKHIDYRFETEENTFTMYVDCGKLDKIVYNLLSNAFKYTPANRTIIFSVYIEREYGYLVIKVEDSGIGISKELQDKLFTRYATDNANRNSIGIGLYLVYELAKAHKGSVSYSNKIEGGSIFTVSIPTDSHIYKPDDFLKKDTFLLGQKQFEPVKNDSNDIITDNAPLEKDTNDTPMNNRIILVIEDDEDIRNLLVTELSPYATVVARPDGTSGYEYARNNDVDLLLCDVMMPGIDGFEVTRRIKDNFETSHIPVILLTALSAEESKLKGIQCGADSYITKPFSRQLLLTRIFKLIEQREKLKEKFSNDISTTRPLISLTAPDKAFADQLTEVIDKNLANPDFTVDDFATAMSLGHTILYRKVKGVTGYAPKAYLRIMRLKKAADLLLQPDTNVSEVAYSVGLNDPLYFSKCFKQQFGVSPTVYRKNGGIPKDKDTTQER